MHRSIGRAVYRVHNLVERLINQPMAHRRIANRYEKRARHYAARLATAVERVTGCGSTFEA